MRSCCARWQRRIVAVVADHDFGASPIVRKKHDQRVVERIHGPNLIDDPADPLKNTRTTIARWWERLLVAPNCVNFHLEHHLAMTVPHYRLHRMHRMLIERGVLADACVTRGYLAVLARAASR